MKNAFFWCIICWCRSKIAKFWNFTHFLAILVYFQISQFFVICRKKILQKAEIRWKLLKLMWKYDFWPFGGSKAEKEWGAPRGLRPGKASQTSPLLELRQQNGNIINHTCSYKCRNQLWWHSDFDFNLQLFYNNLFSVHYLSNTLYNMQPLLIDLVQHIVFGMLWETCWLLVVVGVV